MRQDGARYTEPGNAAVRSGIGNRTRTGPVNGGDCPVNGMAFQLVFNRFQQWENRSALF